ncbi:hypothetical protein Vadar_031531 [Vaccinium darrowii]|uniref:Uncharacterized protein n=1 Tax=Vaccinium darrowii TaxID=229202 RepID=A0ACB7YZM4_9ERIC|nr:hypothetical protein Vadar_031531 [Vaccinium darrowii]
MYSLNVSLNNQELDVVGVDVIDPSDLFKSLMVAKTIDDEVYHLHLMGRGNDEAGKKESTFVGPWGGNGGSPWDDGNYGGVRKISIIHGSCIDSISVVYDKDGKPVAAPKRGGVGRSPLTEIKLQYPNEFLISVSGHYGVFHSGNQVIRSLTFKSTRRTFGPYGVQEGKPFSFSTDGAQIVGFKGRSGSYLDAVGFKLSKSIIQLKDHDSLEWVSGHYAPVVTDGPPVIKSLTFKSKNSKEPFGPYGQERGTPFSFRAPNGAKILGFKGRSQNHLNAIGFHLSKVPLINRMKNTLL